MFISSKKVNRLGRGKEGYDANREEKLFNLKRMLAKDLISREEYDRKINEINHGK